MKLSIRFALIIGILLLIWGTQILITSSSYISSQRVLLGHAGDIMENISDFAIEQAKNHLSLAQGAAHLTKRLLTAEVVGSKKEQEMLLEQYFFDQLVIYPHFAGIYLGTPDGGFHYVSRSDGVPGSAFCTKRIEMKNGQRTVTLIWRDAGFNEIKRESTPDDTYDPRTRPWYQKALAEKSVVWTDPYIFFTSLKPGITIAGPFYTPTGDLRGVVGVDIEIDQLSTFIARLKIGKTGKAFMLNNNGDVVAFPDLSKLMFQEGEDQGIRLAKIEEIDDIHSQKAFNSVTWQYNEEHRIILNTGRQAKFVHAGETYHVTFSPFANRQWPWIMCVYLPESDYLGELKANRRLNIQITLGISILATLFGLYLARGITRPITNLEKEARAVKAKDLTSAFDTRSIYKEIQETADSFLRMKEALLGYERENAEFNHRLKTSEEKYRTLVESMVDAVYMVDGNARYLSVNNRFLTDFGLPEKECVGKSFGELHGPRETFRFTQQVNAVCETGRASQYETHDRTLEQWLLLTLSPVHAEGSGKVTAVSVVAKDITDRVQAEQELIDAYERLKKTQDQLIHNAKLAAVGQLSAGIARQLNEPLDQIMKRIEASGDGTGVQDPVLKGWIRDVLERAHNITSDIILVSGSSDFELLPVEVCSLLEETVRVSGHGQGLQGVTCHTDFPPGGMQVLADRNTLKQVFLNLLANAIDATAERGEIYLRVFPGKALEPGKSIDHRTLEALTHGNRMVVVEIADSGTGIEEENLTRVFDPFFSTKEDRQGSGIGLSIARLIIDRHQGTIDIEARPGGGTRVAIKLPPAAGPAA